MADYYPLLAKAVSGLKTSTPEARRAIYDRARKALLGQLRNMEPPAPESAIERESHALDEAISRLECEFDPPAPPAAEQTIDLTEKLAAALAEKQLAPEPETPPPENSAVEAVESAPQPVFPGSDEVPPAPAEHVFVAPQWPETRDDETEGEPETPPKTIDGPPRETIRPSAPKPDLRDGKSGGRLAIVVGGVIVALGLVGFAAWKLRDRPEDLARLTPNAAEKAEPIEGGKIVERVGGNDANAPAGQTPGSPAIPVGYRAAILVQAPSEPNGVKTYLGTAVWRRDSTNRGPNQQLSGVLRADIDVPEAHFKASMVLEKNFEPALSASHTMTIRFAPEADSPVGPVSQITVPEMRRDDAAKGDPLQGVDVNIADNVFLVGLAASAEKHNADLLKSANWIDVPMSVGGGRIAKITFEKGAAGDRLLAELLTEWQGQQ